LGVKVAEILANYQNPRLQTMVVAAPQQAERRVRFKIRIFDHCEPNRVVRESEDGVERHIGPPVIEHLAAELVEPVEAPAEPLPDNVTVLPGRPGSPFTGPGNS